jgi:tetratricopeptide (TPR) repeat protein
MMAPKELTPQDQSDLKRARDLLKKQKYDRALPILERLKSVYPFDSTVGQLFKMATEGAEGEELLDSLHSEPQEDKIEGGLNEIYRELGMSPTDVPDDAGLRRLFDAMLSTDFAQRTLVDLSVFFAAQHSWNAALKVVDQFLAEDSGLRPEIRLWKMRCLLETERYSEVIAAASGNWSQNYHLPLNYLVGRAYQSLGVKDQARSRYEAVKRLNPDYRDVAIRLRSV